MDLRSEEFYRLLRSRWSVRRFSSEPVPDEVISRILEASTWAPSAHNRQPWRFAVLKNPEVRQRVAGAMGREFYPALRQEGLSQSEAEARVEKSKRRIIDAPVAIVLFLDRSEIDRYDNEVRDRGEMTMAVQSTAIAGGYLLLAAAVEGLGGVWVCAPLFTPAALQQTLELPEVWEPQAILLLGPPEGPPPARSRRGPDEVVRFF